MIDTIATVAAEQAGDVNPILDWRTFALGRYATVAKDGYSITVRIIDDSDVDIVPEIVNGEYSEGYPETAEGKPVYYFRVYAEIWIGGYTIGEDSLNCVGVTDIDDLYLTHIVPWEVIIGAIDSVDTLLPASITIAEVQRDRIIADLDSMRAIASRL